MSQRLRSQRVAQTFTQGRHSMRALECAPARRKCCTTQTRTVLAASQDGTGHSRLTPRPGRLRAFLAGAWLLAASRPGSLVAHRLGPGSCSAALGKRGDLRGRGHLLAGTRSAPPAGASTALGVQGAAGPVAPSAFRARTRSRSRRPLRRSFVGGEASPRCLRSRGVAGGTERVRSGRTVLGHLGPACPGPEGLPSLHGPNWRRGCRQPLGGWPAGWRSTKGSCGAL